MLKHFGLFLLFLVCLTACTEDPTFGEDQIMIDPEATTDDAPSNLDIEYSQLLDLVNRLRSEGCRCGNSLLPPAKPVSWNTKLAAAAQRHSQDMERNNHFDHEGTDGSSFSDRVSEAGYRWQTVGENIARNYMNAQAVFEGWKSSPGHCRNMMNAGFSEMGAARSGAYYTQDFGAPR